MITVDQKELKQWLYALEQERDNYFHGETDGAPEYLYEAIAAIKEALAQPEQNIVEAVKTVLKGIDQTEIESPDGWWETSAGAEFGAKKLKYVIGLLAQPEQEPFRFTNKENWLSGNGRMWSEMNREEGDFPVYTTPPQRTWVGLTDEEISEIACSTQFGISPHDDTLRFAYAITAKLKEKNFS